MATTERWIAYKPVQIAELDRDGWLHDDFQEGQSVRWCAIGFSRQALRGIPDEHPALNEWEGVVDEVVDRLEPQIRDLIYEAIKKRLPWTWEEGER